VITKREYLEGTYLQDRQAIESELFVAEENLNRAKEYFAYSQKLASKGYVNENQLEADRFAVARAPPQHRMTARASIGDSRVRNGASETGHNQKTQPLPEEPEIGIIRCELSARM